MSTPPKAWRKQKTGKVGRDLLFSGAARKLISTHR